MLKVCPLKKKTFASLFIDICQDTVLGIEDGVSKQSLCPCAVEYSSDAMDWCVLGFQSLFKCVLLLFCFVLSVDLGNNCTNGFMYKGDGGYVRTLQFFFKKSIVLWLVWLSGLSPCLQTIRSPVLFWSGHMPGLWARSLVWGAREATDWCIDVFLPPFPSL